MPRIDATDSRLQWMGRTFSDSRGVHLGFPGVTLAFRLRGSETNMEFDATSPDCWFDLVVDGASKPICLDEGRCSVTVCEGLNPDAVHEVKLVRRTESWQGVATVKALTLSDEAELVEPAEPLTRRLLFIGDSITAGTGVEKLPPSYPEGAIGNNANRGFGIELGRRLDAQVHLVAYGGRGLTRDWQGLLDDQSVTAPTFFERSLPDDPATVWDHRRFTPDAITICLGTNDFNTGIPDEMEWTAAYNAFLNRIRQVHPNAWIFLATSPILATADSLRTRAKAIALEHYLDRIVFKRLEEGEERVELVCLRGQPGTERDGHPIASQHLKIADDLEPVIRARLGW